MYQNKRYLSLEQPGDSVQATYVWIDGNGRDLRAKTKTISFVPGSAAQVPKWHYCGQSTGQMEDANDSDTWLIPAALFKDPFRGGINRLVLCDVVRYDGKDTPGCHRKLVAQNPTLETSIAVQEFELRDSNYDPMRLVKTEYCGVGFGMVRNRAVSESLLRALAFAGIRVHSLGPAKSVCSWSLQVGPGSALDVGDQMWMSRFIILRVAEDFNKVVTMTKLTVGGPQGQLDECRHVDTEQHPDKSLLEDPYTLLVKNK